jgi:predicted metal-dependent HD superfamily phosphohydrolase
MSNDLLDRWRALLPDQPDLGEDLLRRYAEPHRRYHTADHLQHVLDMIDELVDGQDLFLVRLAAWFHDAVYAIPAGQVSNEEASARLAIRTLSRVGLEQEDLNQIARLVRLTETHVPGARDPEGELLSDADLAILAAPPRRYAEYATDVRREYAHVSDADFRAGRAAVLADLIARPHLFQTTYARERWEPGARSNVEAELARLT